MQPSWISTCKCVPGTYLRCRCRQRFGAEQHQLREKRYLEQNLGIRPETAPVGSDRTSRSSPPSRQKQQDKPENRLALLNKYRHDRLFATRKNIEARKKAKQRWAAGTHKTQILAFASLKLKEEAKQHRDQLFSRIGTGNEAHAIPLHLTTVCITPRSFWWI